MPFVDAVAMERFASSDEAAPLFVGAHDDASGNAMTVRTSDAKIDRRVGVTFTPVFYLNRLTAARLKGRGASSLRLNERALARGLSGLSSLPVHFSRMIRARM